MSENIDGLVRLFGCDFFYECQAVLANRSRNFNVFVTDRYCFGFEQGDQLRIVGDLTNYCANPIESPSEIDSCRPGLADLFGGPQYLLAAICLILMC